MWYTASFSSRTAHMPASIAIARSAAPFALSVASFARCARSTSSASLIASVWMRRILTRASLFGIGISINRSNRPGRISAGSSMSGLLVAAMMQTSPRRSKPSISERSCVSVRWTSLPPELASSSRIAPIESISSMNRIEGDFFRAILKTSRTRRAPSPTYFCANSDPTTRMNVASVRAATAFARRVFPVPGGP